MAITLTADELNERSREAAREHRRIKQLEEQKKEEAKEISQAIKDAKKEHDRLTEIVSNGVELRMIDCVERLNTAEKMVEIVRVDTDEVVSSRPPTADEQQLHMDEVMRGFEKTAKKHEEEAAITTFGATVISETARDKPLALAASNPAHEPDNDNAKPKRKKKSGAERAREKKAAATAEPKAKKAKQPKPKAEKAPKAPKAKGDKPKPKRAKKPKPVLESHSFEDDEREAI